MELETWTESCSRADVLQVIRNYHENRVYNDAGEDDDDTERKHVREKNAHDTYVAILFRMWGLLLEEPQRLVHVQMSHDYRHPYLPAGGYREYIFLRTSQGRDYQLLKSREFEDL